MRLFYGIPLNGCCVGILDFSIERMGASDIYSKGKDWVTVHLIHVRLIIVVYIFLLQYAEVSFESFHLTPFLLV